MDDIRYDLTDETHNSIHIPLHSPTQGFDMNAGHSIQCTISVHIKRSTTPVFETEFECMERPPSIQQPDRWKKLCMEQSGIEKNATSNLSAAIDTSNNQTEYFD